MSELEGARCVGKWWLFESTLLADHLEARELCDQCPVIAACRERLHGESDPVGTWAGTLVGVGKKKRGRQGKPIAHGTTNGYYQHRNRREDACDKCLEAMRFSSWMRRRYGVAV